MYGPDFWRNDDFSKQAENTCAALDCLSKTIQKSLKRPGPYTVFSHLAHATKRVKDLERVLRRIAALRRELVNLDIDLERETPKDWPAGQPFPQPVQQIYARLAEVSGFLEMDFEALYVYGGILLDQLAALVCHVGELEKLEWYSGLVQRFSKEPGNPGFPTTLLLVWDRHRAELLRHYVSFKIFRDKFIVHHDLPWQRGTSRDFVTGEYKLTSLMAVGWLSPEQEKEAVIELFDILEHAPKWLKAANSQRKMRALELLDLYLRCIDEFDQPTRKRIQQVALKFGFSSPSYHDVAENLLILIADVANTLVEIASSPSAQVKLKIAESQSGTIAQPKGRQE